MIKKIKWLIIGSAAIVFLFPVSSKAIPLTSALEIKSPILHEYLYGLDHTPFIETLFSFPSAIGDVTANLQFVPDYGDNASDFVGFTPGNIALIERGVTFFSTKVLNAEVAGAVGAIIYDNIFQPVISGTLVDITTVPSVFATRDFGMELLGYLQSGSVIVHLAVSPVPEPTSLFLLGSALIVLAGLWRKFKKK